MHCEGKNIEMPIKIRLHGCAIGHLTSPSTSAQIVNNMQNRFLWLQLMFTSKKNLIEISDGGFYKATRINAIDPLFLSE